MKIIKDFDFTGRTIVITGGTGILCSEMARALVALGANVGILARNAEKGAKVIRDMDGPGTAFVVKGDVLDKSSLIGAAEDIISKFGKIDGLINGAGGNSPLATSRADQSFFDLPEEGLRYVFDLNLLGTILPTQIIARHMAERGDGGLLNISSMSAIKPLTRVISYSAAKAAIDNFTQWLSVYLATCYF